MSDEVFAGAGFHVKDEQARVIADAVTSLYRELGRPVQAEDLLEASRDPNAPTHALFEWNDARAAHAYRLDQARYYIRSVKVRESGIETRAVLHVATSEATGYAPHSEVFSSLDLGAQVAQRALADLRVFTRRYQALRDRAELRQVFAAIDAAVGSTALTDREKAA